MDELSRETVNGYTVTIYPDLDPESPRGWTHGAELALSHKRYDLPNDADVNFDSFSSWQEVADSLRASGALVILPVFMLDHSGLSLRVGRDFNDVDPGRWDSGQVGFAYVTAQNWADTQGTEWTGSEDQLARARELIESDVTEYGQYLEGDVYGYVITDAEGDNVESLWGMYGFDYAESEARADAESRPAASFETERKRQNKITELAAKLLPVITDYAGPTLGTARTEGLARKLAETLA